MSITAKWADYRKNAVIVSFRPSWNWHDYKAARDQAGRMIRAVEHDVHIVGDFSQNNGYLPVDALSYFRHTASKLPCNIGKVYIIASRKSLAMRMYQSILRLGAKKLESRVQFVGSVEEAYQLINGYAHA